MFADSNKHPKPQSIQIFLLLFTLSSQMTEGPTQMFTQGSTSDVEIEVPCAEESIALESSVSSLEKVRT